MRRAPWIVATPVVCIYSDSVTGLSQQCSDCTSSEKYRRLPTRKAAGAGACPCMDNRLPYQENIMTICSSAPRSLLLAGAFIGLFTLGAAAQQAETPPAA